MKKIITLATLFGAIILLDGCVKQNAINNTSQEQPKQTVSEKSCQKDDDCACGRHIDTKQCFFGNAKYVDPNLKPCPDFCAGIDGRMQTKCIDGECRQVKVGVKDTAE